MHQLPQHFSTFLTNWKMSQRAAGAPQRQQSDHHEASKCRSRCWSTSVLPKPSGSALALLGRQRGQRVQKPQHYKWGIKWTFNFVNMKYLLLIRKSTVHIPCIHPFVNITLKILLVEAHGRDYGACGPIYHDICQKVIQGKFPVKR